MSLDPLCDVLAVSDARAAFSGGFAAGGPWAIRLRGPGRLKVNALIRGACLLVSEDGGEPLRLTAGDVVVSDGSKPYLLCSEPGLEPIASGRVPLEPGTRMGRIGTGEDVVCLAGHVDLSGDRTGLLRGTLPDLIHVRGDDDAAPALRGLIGQLFDEMTLDRPGARLASDHLAQLIFVQVLRICLTEAAQLPPGWLRALADDQLAQALRLMHDDPGHPWSLEELARSVAMSRTGFTLRFSRTVGTPPLTYLTNWRMNLAARALRQDETPVAVVARSVGYSSESAFSNAFKRAMGIAPRHYRDAARASRTPQTTKNRSREPLSCGSGFAC